MNLGTDCTSSGCDQWVGGWDSFSFLGISFSVAGALGSFSSLSLHAHELPGLEGAATLLRKAMCRPTPQPVPVSCAHHVNEEGRWIISYLVYRAELCMVYRGV